MHTSLITPTCITFHIKNARPGRLAHIGFDCSKFAEIIIIYSVQYVICNVHVHINANYSKHFVYIDSSFIPCFLWFRLKFTVTTYHQRTSLLVLSNVTINVNCLLTWMHGLSILIDTYILNVLTQLCKGRILFKVVIHNVPYRRWLWRQID